MAKLNRREIQQRARALLAGQPEGLRWSELYTAIVAEEPSTPVGSVTGALTALFATAPDIIKVERGTYQLAAQAGDRDDTRTDVGDRGSTTIDIADPVAARLLESAFYQSFARWLVEEAEEVTAAVELGGSVLTGKWGTPDVIGVLRSRPGDLLRFEPQIVSAEIKLDPGQPVVAFGQAVAYRLFSHKSFIVVPEGTSRPDLGRLKALCTIHGMGLVTFALDPVKPDYAIKVLPQQASPDMFYANQMLRRLLDAQPALFNTLFG